MPAKLEIEQTRQTVTDLLCDRLYRQVIENELPPGTKLSEAEMARQAGVSRQPVRDAFYRLSQQGLLQVRPQRATLVTPISADAVMQALFIRSALEAATAREAVKNGSDDDIAALDGLLTEQRQAIEAGDHRLFHRLDDAFHRRIGELSGHGYVWALIREHKAHMDRVRFLSLAFIAGDALEEHGAIVAALKARDGDGAVDAVRFHLSRIAVSVAQVRKANPGHFDQDET